MSWRTSGICSKSKAPSTTSCSKRSWRTTAPRRRSKPLGDFPPVARRGSTWSSSKSVPGATSWLPCCRKRFSVRSTSCSCCVRYTAIRPIGSLIKSQSDAAATTLKALSSRCSQNFRAATCTSRGAVGQPRSSALSRRGLTLCGFRNLDRGGASGARRAVGARIASSARRRPLSSRRRSPQGTVPRSGGAP